MLLLEGFSVDELELRKQLFEMTLRTKMDARFVAYDIAIRSNNQKVLIEGNSLMRQTDAFIRKTASDVFGEDRVEFHLTVLNDEYKPSFYQVVVPAAGFHKFPNSTRKMELLTQGLYGSVIRGYFVRDGFLFAQHSDGYFGYVPFEFVQKVEERCYLRWKNGKCAVLRDVVRFDGVSIPPCTRLVYQDGKVQLTSGEWVRISARQMIEVNPCQPAFVRAIAQQARVFVDTKYMWGGKTEAGIDCSGLVQSLFVQHGIQLPRDANMQAAIGEIAGYLPGYRDVLPGDLVFFMNDNAQIYHVGVHMGGNKFLHASLTKNIACSSFHRSGENYVERFSKSFAFGRRLRPQQA